MFESARSENSEGVVVLFSDAGTGAFFSFSTFPLFDCILAPFVSTVNRRVLIFLKKFLAWEKA